MHLPGVEPGVSSESCWRLTVWLEVRYSRCSSNRVSRPPESPRIQSRRMCVGTFSISSGSLRNASVTVSNRRCLSRRARRFVHQERSFSKRIIIFSGTWKWRWRESNPRPKHRRIHQVRRLPRAPGRVSGPWVPVSARCLARLGRVAFTKDCKAWMTPREARPPPPRTPEIDVSGLRSRREALLEVSVVVGNCFCCPV